MQESITSLTDYDPEAVAQSLTAMIGDIPGGPPELDLFPQDVRAQPHCEGDDDTPEGPRFLKAVGLPVRDFLGQTTETDRRLWVALHELMHGMSIVLGTNYRTFYESATKDKPLREYSAEEYRFGQKIIAERVADVGAAYFLASRFAGKAPFANLIDKVIADRSADFFASYWTADVLREALHDFQKKPSQEMDLREALYATEAFLGSKSGLIAEIPVLILAEEEIGKRPHNAFQPHLPWSRRLPSWEDLSAKERALFERIVTAHNQASPSGASRPGAWLGSSGFGPQSPFK